MIKSFWLFYKKNPAGEENPVGKETGGWGLGFEVGCRALSQADTHLVLVPGSEFG